MNSHNKNKIFLSLHPSKTIEEKRLFTTLQRAGFNSSLSDNANAEIENSFCSVHFVSNKYAESMEEDFTKALEKINKDAEYKTFLWMPQGMDYADADTKQLDFINRLQNHLYNNMILSRVPSAIQFVEDVRIILEQQQRKIYDTETADIFLIANQTDEKDAIRIQTMLSGIIKLVKLIIIQDSDIDYEEYASQQMNVSTLSVIYYKNACDWAHPFVQQIWKKVGGASAKSPILFIGDANSTKPVDKKFDAPNVTSYFIPNELIPLEIKVQFDAVSEKK